MRAMPHRLGGCASLGSLLVMNVHTANMAVQYDTKRYCQKVDLLPLPFVSTARKFILLGYKAHFYHLCMTFSNDNLILSTYRFVVHITK